MSKRLTLFAAALALMSGTAILPAAAQDKMNGKEKTVNVGGAPMYPSKNIIQNAVNSKDHTTLVAAVKAAGLVDTLQGAGPFTVFAPTNAAFAKLPAGTVDNLVKPENKAQADQDPHLSRRAGPDDGRRPDEGDQGRRRHGQAQDRRRATTSRSSRPAPASSRSPTPRATSRRSPSPTCCSRTA